MAKITTQLNEKIITTKRQFAEKVNKTPGTFFRGHSVHRLRIGDVKIEKKLYLKTKLQRIQDD